MDDTSPQQYFMRRRSEELEAIRRSLAENANFVPSETFTVGLSRNTKSYTYVSPESIDIGEIERKVQKEMYDLAYEDTKSQLFEAGIGGLVKVDRPDGTQGIEINDPKVEEFVGLRASAYSRGDENALGHLRWSKYDKDAFTKWQARYYGLMHNFVVGSENLAGSTAAGVARWAHDLAFYSGDGNQQQQRSASESRSPEQIEADREDFVESARRFGRDIASSVVSSGNPAALVAVRGVDPDNPEDARAYMGRAGGGFWTSAAEMTGSALASLPYSVPALMTRNPKAAALLTSPFFFSASESAYQNRLSIWKEQDEAARSAGLPRPARPSNLELMSQAAFAGGAELLSETVGNVIQVPIIMGAGRVFGKVQATRFAPEAVKETFDGLSESMARHRGPLGTAKKAAGAVVAGAKVAGIEAVEEAFPQAAQEISDAIWIPAGYESDFFSESTAEAMGTGFIAGGLMFGGIAPLQSTIGKAARESRARSRMIKDAEKRGLLGAMAQSMIDKQDRIARENLVANSAYARTEAMVMHAIDEVASGRRSAVLVPKDDSDNALTSASREQMDRIGLVPIGVVGLSRDNPNATAVVYAHPSMREDVMSAANAGDVNFLFGRNPTVVAGEQPTVAVVTRNSAGQIVDLLPFSRSEDAEARRAAIEADAATSGLSVEVVDSRAFGGIEQSIREQRDAQSAIRVGSVVRPSVAQRNRGINSLRLEMRQSALGSKATRGPSGADDAPFASRLLTAKETNGATNEDVEVDVELSEVSDESLAEGESDRLLSPVGGVKPTILDAKVVYRIRQKDGSVRTIEKDTENDGAYLAQSSPDGVFLLRKAGGTAFTRRNAFATLMHELRHKGVVQSRALAEYMGHLLFLDPDFALRGGLDYMLEATPDAFKDAEGNPMTEEQVLVGYASQYGAAVATLADAEGYQNAVRTLRDPNASQQQKDSASQRIREQERAYQTRSTMERFAEESVAQTQTEGLGQTAQAGAEWLAAFKGKRERSLRSFGSWMAYQLAKRGFAGPQARQALYEIESRMSGKLDSEMRIFDQARRETEARYREGMRAWLDSQATQPAPEQGGGAASPAQSERGMAGGASFSRRPLEGAQGVPATILSAPPEEERPMQKAGQTLEQAGQALKAEGAPTVSALASAVNAMASILPMLTQTLASVQSASGGRPSIPRMPRMPATEQAQAAAEPIPEPLESPTEPTTSPFVDMQSIDPRDRRAMMSLRPIRRSEMTPEMAAWSEGSQVVDENGDLIPVFHGTADDFDRFQGDMGRRGPEGADGLFYFSPNADDASDYATGRQKDIIDNIGIEQFTREGGGARVIPAVLSAKNLFDSDNPRHVKALRRFGVSRDDIDDGHYENLEQTRVLNAIKAAGFDGMYVRELDAQPAEDRDIAVFNANQIKGYFNERPTQAPEIMGSRRTLRGEWWLTDSGPLFADGDVGDMNHEMLAQQEAVRDLASNFRQLASAATDNALKSSLEQFDARIEEMDQGDGWDFNEAQDMVRTIVGDEGITAFMESAGVPQEQREQFRRRANFAMGLGDPREYGFDKNWVRVQGNNIQMRGLNDSSLRSVADKLYEAEGEKVLDQVFTVEDMAARRTYDDVPFDALEKGIRGLAPYRGASYSRRSQPPAGMQVATRFTVGAANMGLLNNQVLNYDKLNDEEEAEVVALLNYGLEQPRDVPNRATFYFTEEGLQTNARLIELLKKAARGPVRETKVFAPLNPLWASRDGQIAVLPKDVMEIPPDASSDIMGSRRPPLYSGLKKEMLSVDSERLSPQAWTQRIAALVNKGTVKSDEVEWSGITDFLRLAGGNKVSKQEISDYLDQNGIQIERVVGASEPFARRRFLAEQLYEEFRANPPRIPFGTDPDSQNPAERPLVGSYGERVINAVNPNRFKAHNALESALEMTGHVHFYDDVGGYSVWMEKTDEYGTRYSYALGGNTNPSVFQTEEEAEDAIEREIANVVRVARRDVDRASSGVAQLNDMLSTFLELQDPLLGKTRLSDEHMQFITDIAERSGNPRAVEIAKELVEANKPDKGAVYGEPKYKFVGLGGHNYRETILRLPKIKGKRFPRSYSDVSPETPDSDLGFESHNWAILNPVAHYRTDEAQVLRPNSLVDRVMRVFEIQSDWAQGRRSGEEKLQGADVRLPADHPLKRRIEELKAPMAPLDEEERRLNRPAVNLAASSYYLDAAEDWFKTRFAIPFPLELYRTFRDGTLGRDGIERFFDRVKEMRPAAGAISPERDVSEAEIDAIRDYVLARHAMRDPQKLLKEAKRDLRLAEAELRQRAGVTEEEASATERDAPFVTSQKFGVFKDGAEVLYTDEKGNQNPRRYQSMREAEIAAEKVGGEARDLGKRADTEGFVNLALRNIVLDAIEMGYTSIAFATGSQVNKALRQNPESVAGKGNVKFYDDVLPKIIQKFVKKMNAGTLTKAGVGTIDQRGAEPWRTNTVLDMSPEFIERAKNGLAMMSRRNQTGGAIGAAMRIAGGEPPRKFKTEDAFFLGPAAGFPALLRRGRGQLKPDARNIREAARRAVQDVSAWLGKENRRFADYYENDWKATRGFLEAHYKRPLTDEEMRVARFLAGVTSPNTALAANITDMVMLLDHWMAKGNFDAFEFGVNDKGAPKGVTGPYEISGNSAPNKLKVIKSVEKIAERLGSWDAALEYMMQTDTIKNLSEEKKSLGYKGGVGEVGKVRRVVEYASGTSDVVPRLFMFGPKVGAYTMNALGDSRYTTVDLWESRFIRAQFKGMFEENTGLPVGEEEHDLFVRFGELFNEEWKKATGDDMQPSALQAVRWFYIIDTAKRLGYSKASTNETISNYTARSIESRLQRRGTDQTGRFSGDGSPQGRGVVGEISYSRRPESSDQLSRDRGGQRTAGVYSPLEGAPVVEGATGPDPSIVQVAEQYAKDNGINLKRQARYAMVDEERARRIAQAYEDMQHSPSDPTVAEAYENLIKQTTAQYKALESAGYRFWLFDENSDPYEGKPWRAMRDLRSNKQMGVFDTAAGFGTSDFDPSQNPLLADTGIKWPFGNPNGPLRPVLANDLFRAVHDAFGHGMEGSGFRAQGEENAWQAHVRLFTGSAVGALTSETRGQNSWLNFGPYAEQNKTANVFETKFADQKTGLMPSWTWTEGRVEDETLPTDPSTAMDPLTGERVIKSMMSMRRGVRGIKDEATLRYLDRFDEVLRATRVAEERTGTALADVANPYLGARLLQGNIAQQQLDAEARYADLLRRQHVAGISLDDMDRFLYAQHAEERNRYIARIDPTRPDGGSGMTNADAAAEIARVQRSGRLPVFERFADEWRMMLQEALDARIDAGLVRPEVYAAINAEYKRYVPLRGIAARDPWDADFEEMGPQYGRGLSTTGRGMPMAAGRRSEASGITSQVAYVHEDTIRRIARNDVGQRFLRMMRAINDRAWGEVVRPTRRIVVDGAVRVVHDPTWTSDGRHFGVYVDEPMTINGHDYVAGDMVVIRINNRRLADAMLQPSMDLRAWERGLRAVNNVWRYMTTGPANPAFAPVNMLRDVGTATLNNMVTRGFMDTAGMLSRWPLAFARVMRDEWLGNGNATGTYRRFLAAGGGQVYWKENDLDVKRTDFEALARRVERRDPNDRSLAKTLFGWYTAFFAAAETASRLAQFEQRLAAGDSVQTAALAGRDITVDFSKGGLAKPALNTWYVFLNAALQGNANIISGLIRNPVRAALTMPHLILFGYVMAAMARAMGGEDEERGQSRWDNLRDEDKTAKIFFFDPSGSGKYISLPMPYGYNVLVSAGVRLEAAINGTDRASDVIGGTFNDALAAFNPIGGSGIKSGTEGLLTSLAPTMARPIAEITANTDFAGRPIYREQMGRVQQPDSQMAFEFTPEGWRTLAQSLNSATGGDEFESGFVDASPDTLRYLAGYYLSGTGRLLDRLYTAMSDPSKAELNDIPIMRSFVGDAANDRRSVSRQYYEIANSLAPTALRVREVESPTSAERLQSAVEGLDPEKVALNEIVSKTENELRKLRQVSKGATPEQQEAIAAVRRALQTSVIKQKNLLDKASRTE